MADLPLLDAIMAFVKSHGHRSSAELSLRERRRLAARIDRMHAQGEAWPFLPREPDLPSTAWLPLVPRVHDDERRAPSPRPDHLPYCIRWTGAFWAPCSSLKQRRDAGYLPFMMVWSGDLPRASEYLTSGPRARFAYRVAEVERFSTPRGRKGYTCRIWCNRVDPQSLPRGAVVREFFWHPRGKRGR